MYNVNVARLFGCWVVLPRGEATLNIIGRKVLFTKSGGAFVALFSASLGEDQRLLRPISLVDSVARE